MRMAQGLRARLMLQGLPKTIKIGDDTETLRSVAAALRAQILRAGVALTRPH